MIQTEEYFFYPDNNSYQSREFPELRIPERWNRHREHPTSTYLKKNRWQNWPNRESNTGSSHLAPIVVTAGIIFLRILCGKLNLAWRYFKDNDRLRVISRLTLCVFLVLTIFWTIYEYEFEYESLNYLT